LVTAPDLEPAKARRHEINCLGGPADVDDLAVFTRIEEARELGPGPFVRCGRGLAQRVHAPMDVRVAGLVVVTDRVDDGVGLLAGGPVVEIHQRPAVRERGENREVAPHPRHIPRGGGAGGSGPGAAHGAARVSTPSRAQMARSRSSRTGTLAMRVSTSAAKP